MLASIMNTLSFILPFLGVLTVVVFIHELGHFLVARWCGVKVQAFSIGFGRELFGFNDKHGTRWRFAWIPLGGYVRFIDDETAASTSTKGSLERLNSEDRAGAFQSKPVGQRALVVAAGPAFNIISAVLSYAMAFWWFGLYGTAAVVDEVVPESPAAKAGLKAGDRITQISGQPIEWFSDLQKVVSQSAGETLALRVDRDGKLIELALTPHLQEVTDPLGNKVQVPMIGVKRTGGRDKIEHRTYSPPAAFVKALTETRDVSWQIISSLPKLPGAIVKTLSGQRQSEIGGPVAIAEMTAHATKSGTSGTLTWIAVFSIMLGIMNLLPIPVLDGGHLVFYAYEAVRGQPLDEKKQELGFRIGLAILATMMFAALLGDIMRKLGIG
ncbi:MAG: RIP metalloprotease RseP [Hyphomicrobiaceae bacterium]